MTRHQAKLRQVHPPTDDTVPLEVYHDDTQEMEPVSLIEKMDIQVPAPWEILIRTVHSLVAKRKMLPSRAEWYIRAITELTEEARAAGDASVLVWGGDSGAASNNFDAGRGG